LNFNFGLNLDFDFASGVSLDCSQGRSLPVDGLRSNTFLFFPILINKLKTFRGVECCWRE